MRGALRPAEKALCHVDVLLDAVDDHFQRDEILAALGNDQVMAIGLCVSPAGSSTYRSIVKLSPSVTQWKGP